MLRLPPHPASWISYRQGKTALCHEDVQGSTDRLVEEATDAC